MISRQKTLAIGNGRPTLQLYCFVSPARLLISQPLGVFSSSDLRFTESVEKFGLVELNPDSERSKAALE
jgi:hypothetical protein